jgi:GNAT superfamily N-acetyltransferase
MRESLFLQNSIQDPNVYYPGSWIALENLNNEVVGMVISKIWQEDIDQLNLGKELGWIQVLLVDSRYRGKGIGSNLLHRAESSLLSQGVKLIKLGTDPWHYFPGIPREYLSVKKWFENRGYVKNYSVHDLVNSYAKQKELPELAEVSIRLLSRNDQDRFVQFLQRSFSARWQYEAISYFNRGGTGREFVVFEKEGEFIGFCRINDSQSPVIGQNTYWSPLIEEESGGIGPLGIAKEHRKNGYGLAIVQSGIYFLQQRGIRHIVIDWTDLVEFYGKLGFKVYKSYDQYQKAI